MKQLYKLIFIGLGLITFANSALAQIDNEFWFAAPSLIAEHTPNTIKLVVVAYDDDAIVSISQPAAGRVLLASRMVERHSVFEFSLNNIPGYRETIETVADGNVHPNGIYLKSTSKVTAYYVASAQNSEVYTLKGDHGLGTEFVVPTQFTNRCGHNTYSSTEVVATEDNTEVTFITFVPTNMSATADTIRVTLNRGESYALRSRDRNTPAAMHLGGTIVRSDKPICVNSTDDSVEWGSNLDLIGEQLVPTTLAGSRYILPTNAAARESVTFFAVEDSARIYMVDFNNDTTFVGIVHPGEHLDRQLQTNQGYVFYSEENAPFVAFHLTGVAGELSGTVLPSLNCSGSQEVNYKPSLSPAEAQVTILVHTEDVNSFLVNGDYFTLQESDFQVVPGDTTWSYTSCKMISLLGGLSSFCIQNTTGLFHMGILDFGDGAASYGYFSNYGQVSLFAEPQQYYYYIGDTIRLHLTGSSTFTHINWVGPNGAFATDEKEPMLPNITTADAGMYIVSAEHEEGCEVSPDTFFVHVFPAMNNREKDICRGDSIHLRANGMSPFQWEEDGKVMAGETNRSATFEPEQTTVYTIREQVRGCEMIEWDSVALDYADYFEYGTGDQAVIWSHAYGHLIPGAEYLWRVRFRASGNTVAPKVILYADDETSGIIAVQNNGITVADLRFVGTNKPVRLRLALVSPEASQQMSVVSMSLRPTMDVMEQIKVNVAEPFLPNIIGPDTLCEASATLSVDFAGTHYLWSTGDTTATIEATKPGKYCVYVWNGACYEMACHTIEACPEPEPEPCRNFFIAQRWNDVLFVMNKDYNGGYDFVAYQWYKNGEKIEGATQAYLFIQEGLQPGDVYSVLCYDALGTEYMSCDYEVGAPKAAPQSTTQKIIRNGNIYILRDGQLYTIYGQLME